MKDLSAAQLRALDYLESMGGQASAGNAMLPLTTAGALTKRGDVERVSPDGEPWSLPKYRITQQGQGERARARDDKTDSKR